MLRTAGLISMIGLVFGLGSAAGSSSDISPEESRPAGPAHLVVATAKPAPVKQQEVCPADMVLVEGEYCPEVKQTCLKYMDGPGRYEQFRCAEYAQPAKCASNYRVSMRFCIDRDEYAEPGESRPANFKSFSDAKKTCSAQGKRVCAESEWNFACEGEEMRPYPAGYRRHREGQVVRPPRGAGQPPEVREPLRCTRHERQPRRVRRHRRHRELTPRDERRLLAAWSELLPCGTDRPRQLLQRDGDWLPLLLGRRLVRVADEPQVFHSIAGVANAAERTGALAS